MRKIVDNQKAVYLQQYETFKPFLITRYFISSVKKLQFVQRIKRVVISRREHRKSQKI